MKRVLAGTALLVAVGLSSGCGLVFSRADFGDELHALRRRGVQAECEESIHVGPMLLALGRQFVASEAASGGEASDPDADLARVAMNAISSLDLGVFRVTDAPENVGLLVPSFAGDGWEPIVRVRSRNESAQVLVRESRGKLRGLMVAALDANELTLVRIQGDMEPLLEVALAGGLTSDGGPLKIARD